jgi:hypothetical protein
MNVGFSDWLDNELQTRGWSHGATCQRRADHHRREMIARAIMVKLTNKKGRRAATKRFP